MKMVLLLILKSDGDYPKYGNNDDRVDTMAVEIVENIHEETA